LDKHLATKRDQIARAHKPEDLQREIIDFGMTFIDGSGHCGARILPTQSRLEVSHHLDLALRNGTPLVQGRIPG
jgi:hypothetical protein